MQYFVTPLSLAEWVSGSPRASNYFGQLFVYDYSQAPIQLDGVQIFQEFSNPIFTLTGQQVRERHDCNFSMCLWGQCVGGSGVVGGVCMCSCDGMWAWLCMRLST